MQYAIKYKGGMCYHVFSGINAMKPWDEHMAKPETGAVIEDMFIIWNDERKKYAWMFHKWGR